MNKELMEALHALCEEKGMSPDVIFDALEAALVAAYKRNFNSSQNVEVFIDRETGKVQVMAQKKVVDLVFEDSEEIDIEDARKIDPSYEIDDIVNIEVTPRDFGRVSAMTAKQVITQRIREAERGMIYSEYNEKTNEIVVGEIERIEHGNVFVDIGKTEGMLPLNEQPKGETYEVGQLVKCYVSGVRQGTRGAQILLSRTHPGLVRRLFETEVPEIADGTVEIKGIAREGGSRTKIAVYSNNPDIDAQGACIGQGGVRVQRIGDELKNEKIDIVKWSEDPKEYITSALSPAKVERIDINEEEHSASVGVPEYQLSLAIGKAGQNVRLAAKLTGWKIDISAV
ncbi:MAG TPA: transcription termination/antitermination protein NusA [Candidatus Ornithomonoglobus intestinigallinarum]|uniref:Transcription termination/antitermination protein NusA n=1 Tax=Candidatus Ornithomonoglobus intestinigallinarum TaxID=2840894 RepID=A0A9D1KQD7_9FIRM|nr:transcription termination/antitermination protein NusA [Candidatus Ornithomonoglobus intestinigallinarum]